MVYYNTEQVSSDMSHYTYFLLTYNQPTNQPKGFCVLKSKLTAHCDW